VVAPGEGTALPLMVLITMVRQVVMTAGWWRRLVVTGGRWGRRLATDVRGAAGGGHKKKCLAPCSGPTAAPCPCPYSTSLHLRLGLFLGRRSR
jgi:hypothetical protein